MRNLILVISVIFAFEVSWAQTCEQVNANEMSVWTASCLAHPPSSGCAITPVYIFSRGAYNDNPTLSINCEIKCTGLPDGSLGYNTIGFCDKNAIPTALRGSFSVQAPTIVCGSIVEVESQVVGETIPVVGASFTMNYFTNWVQGKTGDYKLIVPISGTTPRDDISSFDLQLELNGSVVQTTSYVNSTSNVKFEYNWDGNISSVPTLGSKIFDVTVVEHHTSIDIPVKSSIAIGSLKSILLGLGGWLPSVYHFYDVASGNMYAGDGSIQKVVARSWSTTGFMVAEKNNSLVYYFDSSGRQIYTKTGLLGATIYTFNYNGSGQLNSISEPFGRTTTFDRNISGDFISITAPKGQVTTVSLDSNGYLAAITNPNSETYNMTYGTDGLLATFEKPGAQVSTFTYDSDGNLSRDVHSGGYFLDLIKNSSSYSLDYTSKTRMGLETRQYGSAYQDQISRTTTYPNSTQEIYSFTPNGATATESSSSRNVTQNFSYVEDKRFLGMQTRFPYSYTFQNGYANYTVTNTQSVTLSTPTDPFSISAYSVVTQKGSFVETAVFDPSTKVFSGNTSLGRTTGLTLDTMERIISVQKGSLTATDLTYTNENLTKIKQGTRETNLTYDSLTGFLSTFSNPLSHSTAFTYDSAGRLASKILPDLRVVQFGYDANGNVSGITPPGRTIHSFGIDSSELPSSYEPPTLSGVITVNTTYSYDNDKKLTQVSKPNGDTISFLYNSGSGKLYRINTSSGTTDIDTDYSTGLPSMINISGGFKNYIGYAGDKPFQISTYNPSWGMVSTFTRSIASSGLIDSDTISAATSSTINYIYDDDELLTGAGDLTLAKNTPNGMLTATSIGTSPNIVTDSYTYNSFGEVTGYQAKYGTTVIYDLTLGRDGMGRINSKTQTMNSTTDAYDYTFDTTGRLTQVDKNSTTVATYGYDDNSNRNSGTIGAQPTTATYDAQDRMTAYNLLTFTYNANGDLTGKTNTLTSATTSYTYDVFGNLTSVTLPSTDVITYEIDGLNRRIGKRINGTLQARWVYMDQTRIAAELDASGNIAKRFVYASKGNIPDYMIMGGDNYRIISDQLGSPRLVVKVSDGSIAERMDHDEYGRVIADTNPGLLPFGFAGGLYDVDTGLVRFGARDYDSETGRWTSKDPILFGGKDTNLFGYTWNDPINWLDSRGLWGFAVGGNIGGYIGGGFDISGGLYVGYQNGRFFWGMFGSGNSGFGVGAGAGVQGTYYPNACSISGSSMNYNAQYGLVTGTIVTDPKSGETTGYGGGIGTPGKGASITIGDTVTIGTPF